MAHNTNTMAVIHVRYAGRSSDVPISLLEITAGADDRQIKRSLAQYLEVPTASFENYVVDRHPNGNLTVRPEAVFG